MTLEINIEDLNTDELINHLKNITDKRINKMTNLEKAREFLEKTVNIMEQEQDNNHSPDLIDATVRIVDDVIPELDLAIQWQEDNDPEAIQDANECLQNIRDMSSQSRYV